MTGVDLQIISAAISDRGLSKKRPQNEDSFLEANERGLFVVADGVGGAQAGDVASQMAVEILGEAFANLRQTDDAEELMKKAIERANASIYQMSHDLQQLSSMATTIVALKIAQNIATIGHVGDSRLYRLNPKGDFFRETQDHSMVEEEVRAGRMTAEQAANHPSRNVISRALGAEDSVEVDLKTIMTEPNTIFLLCSDGITRHIDDFELRELLLKQDSPENICRLMKEICYERGAEDNLTAVIVKLTDSKAEKSPIVTNKQFSTVDEDTVATARQRTNKNVVESSINDVETPTQPLVLPVSNAVIADNVPVSQENVEVRNESINIPVTNNEIEENHSSSAKLSRLLSSILLLIVGALFGAGIYYLFLQNNPPPEPPQITQMQSSNIEFSSFETLRRSVDSDPNLFINRTENTSQDAESLYLLGRAYLLTGKFPEAKKYLEEAKNKLAQTNLVNSKVISNDISLSLAIIDEAGAQNKFQNQVNANNSNSNAASNMNTKIP